MNDKIKEEEVNELKIASMKYPTWNEIKKLLGVQFDEPKPFGNNPLSIEEGNDSIYSNIDGDIIEKDEGSTPCGIDIPVLLKPKPETNKPLIVILGESALRSEAELKDIKDPKNPPSNVILGTPYAIHLEKCPPKCGVYRKIFDAILEKGYPIYLTDIIKIWWKGKKDSLLVPNDLDIVVFKNELDILKKEKINNNIIIVAWGEKPKDALQKKFNMIPDVDFLPLPHPGQKNWNAWKLRIFEKAVFSGKLEYATNLYGKKPDGKDNKTTAEKVAIEAVKSIDDYINCNIFFFESDDEFTDFCIAPYAVVKRSSEGTLFVEGQYSDMYKKYIEQGKTFIIKDENSQVYKRQCVSKRVPVKIDDFPSYDRLTLVQLPVQNLKPYFEDLEDL
jgi:hypothetical protein